MFPQVDLSLITESYSLNMIYEDFSECLLKDLCKKKVKLKGTRVVLGGISGMTRIKQ